MFVGHYGVSFAAKRAEPSIPLFGLEAALLFGGICLCLRGRFARSPGTVAFGVVMLGVQAYIFFGPPPGSDRAAAWTALIAYAAFAAVIWWLQDRRAVAG